MSSSVSATAVTTPEVFKLGALLTTREKWISVSSSAFVVLAESVIARTPTAERTINIVVRREGIAGLGVWSEGTVPHLYVLVEPAGGWG